MGGHEHDGLLLGRSRQPSLRTGQPRLLEGGRSSACSLLRKVLHNRILTGPRSERIHSEREAQRKRSRQKLDRFPRHQQGRNIAIHARPQPQQTVGIISQRPSTIPEQPAAVTATTSEPQFERRLASAAQVYSGPWSLASGPYLDALLQRLPNILMNL